MPFAKRGKYSTKKKVSRARVPRLLTLNGSLVHKHVITLSTSTTEALIIKTPIGGVAQFSNFTSNSANMQLSFTLAGMVLHLAGIAVATYPLPNVAELKALYDSYVIEKVDVSLWSGATQAQTGSVPDVSSGLTGSVYYQYVPMPMIGYTVDMDDAANTSQTSLQQYSQYKCVQLGQSRPIRISVVPCVNDTLSNGTGYGRGAYQVINSANDTVQHFGIKMCVDGFKAEQQGPNEINCLFCIQAKYHLRMISTR